MPSCHLNKPSVQALRFLIKFYQCKTTLVYVLQLESFSCSQVIHLAAEAEESVIVVNLDNVPPCAKRKLVLNKTMKNDLKKYQHKFLFFVDALVFARIRGYPAWPAKVVDIMPRSSFKVVFFGTGEIGYVTISNIYQYCEYTMEIFTTDECRRKLATQFAKAVEEIQTEYESIANLFWNGRRINYN